MSYLAEVLSVQQCLFSLEKLGRTNFLQLGLGQWGSLVDMDTSHLQKKKGFWYVQVVDSTNPILHVRHRSWTKSSNWDIPSGICTFSAVIWRIVWSYASNNAIVYRDSEELIGQWFERTGKRDQIFLCAKFGSVRDPDGTTRTANDRATIRASIERSMQDLKTEKIDLYYVHRWRFPFQYKR